MNDAINTCAEEILGLKFVCLLVGDDDVEIKLRPLTVKQQLALQHETFLNGTEALLAEAHESARRGGYEGTRDDFAELLVGDDLLEIEEAIKQLNPLAVKRMVEQAKLNAPDPEVVAAMMKAIAELPSKETSGEFPAQPVGALTK